MHQLIHTLAYIAMWFCFGISAITSLTAAILWIAFNHEELNKDFLSAMGCMGFIWAVGATALSRLA